MSAPGGAAETLHDQDIRRSSVALSRALRPWFLPPRIPRVTTVTRSTLGYDFGPFQG
jgi:hypothetical protein